MGEKTSKGGCQCYGESNSTDKDCFEDQGDPEKNEIQVDEVGHQRTDKLYSE